MSKPMPNEIPNDQPLKFANHVRMWVLSVNQVFFRIFFRVDIFLTSKGLRLRSQLF